MERHYVDNPSLHEQRTSRDVLLSLSKSEQAIFKSMTQAEVLYLKNDCYISAYIEHLRKGAEHRAVGSDFPVLVVKGSKLQLERFRLTFLITLIDYQGTKVYHPVDFQLDNEAYAEAQEFPGVAIIKIPYGSSTTEGFDKFRSDLITDVLTVRRENFNPTLVLIEETISGRLNTSSDLIKYIILDQDKLRGSLDGSKVKVDNTVASRKKEERVFTPTSFSTPRRTENNKTPHSYSSNTWDKDKNKKKDTKSKSALVIRDRD